MELCLRLISILTNEEIVLHDVDRVRILVVTLLENSHGSLVAAIPDDVLKCLKSFERLDLLLEIFASHELHQRKEMVNFIFHL